MGHHRTFSYQPHFVAPKRPFKRSGQIFLIEWTPVIVTLVLAALILGLVYQIAS